VRQAGVREARQNLSVLLEFVSQGHEVLITDRGTPVARLVAPLPLSARPFGGRSALRRAMPRLDPPLSAALGGAPDAAAWPRRLHGPLYLDATALAKIYLPEQDSTGMERALRGRRDLTVSELAVTEFMAGYALRLSEVRRKGTAARLQVAIHEDLDSGCLRRVDLSAPAHRAAERLALSLAERKHAVGASAALHLALAMTAGVATVVTFDPTLARAAHALGLSTLPERKRR
jgi:antitoxin (DNA-binding transcriptional repressor) of toxin-antitoxin stability system/predicted nucleic acid-binding protein